MARMNLQNKIRFWQHELAHYGYGGDMPFSRAFIKREIARLTALLMELR
jgi:hypothetical protein